MLLDWENWGRLPVGYDIGLLGAHSLPAPSTAARIHHEFSHILDTAAGRAEELVMLGQLLQSLQQRCPSHAHPHIERRAEHLTGTPVPAS